MRNFASVAADPHILPPLLVNQSAKECMCKVRNNKMSSFAEHTMLVVESMNVIKGVGLGDVS